MKTIFEAGGQLIKLRLLILFLLACAAGSIWAGVYFAQSYGVNPGDGGVLAPLSVRLAGGAGFFLFGISLAVGTWLFAKCYVTGIALDEQTGILHISSARFFGTRTDQVPVSKIISSRFYKGFTEGTSDSAQVHAPFRTVRIEGRKLPLLLDLQGELIELELLKRLFKSNEKWGKSFGILLALSSSNFL